MNCYKASCRHKDDTGNCRKDGKPCDYIRSGHDDSCHIAEAEGFSQLSCYNACEYYNTCTET